MADIPQVLATYDALVGVALGAGLTYGFGALNRRHQEAREKETRWYQVRLEAYKELIKSFVIKRQGQLPGNSDRVIELVDEISLRQANGVIHEAAA